MIRLALLEEATEEVLRHLAAASPREEGAFCLLWEAKGHHGRRLLASRPFLSTPASWEQQRPDSLRPTAQWMSAAVSFANKHRAGLLFIHSHPDAYHPPGLSLTDVATFEALAPTFADILDGPLAAAVVHPSGWSCAEWCGGRLTAVERIISIGRTLRFLSPMTVLPDSDLDSRQRDALGTLQDYLRTLTVAVVGVGGLGAPIAEQLVRVGLAELILIDHDLLDTPSNARRIPGTRLSDVNIAAPNPKVEVIGDYLDGLGFDVTVRKVQGDVRYEEVFRHLLDADVVMLATDNHSSRATVNDLASTYLLPVIDTGVRVGSKANGDLSGLLAEVRVLTPTTPCLWCRRTIDADTIRQENLPPGERQRLVKEGYATNSIIAPAPSVMPLTVLGAGMATCALLGLLAKEGEVTPAGYWFDGLLGDSRGMKIEQPVANCRCGAKLGRGDTSPPPFKIGP